MLRIAHRSILLLLCTVMLVSLIAARPLAPRPASFQVGGAVLQDLPSAVTVHKTSAIARAYQARRPATAQALRLAEIKTRRELARATAAQPRPRAVAPAAPARIAGEGPWMRGQRVAQTARLDLYVGKRTFTADQVAALAPRIEQALRAAERRFGTTLKHRVSLGFYGVPLKKGVRGMAYTDERRAELFYRPDDDLGGAVTIAAHEL